MASFGETLKRVRESKNLTQHDLASRLRERGYGTTQTTVSRWESGQEPRGYVLAALAEELGVKVDELFGADEDEEAASMQPFSGDIGEMFTALVHRAVEAKLAEREQVA